MDIIEITNRIKTLLNLRNDNEVAKLLGLGVTAFSERKRSGSIPYKNMIEWAEREDISIIWLLTGEDEEHKDGWSEEEQAMAVMLVDILRGSNLDNVEAIKTNVRAFHKSRNMDDDPEKTQVRQKRPKKKKTG